eukprot:TRINITY_DN4168_c0_g2_i1.p1 TRINITY_DN4168_c0_g2~~TRINITY_DN4168_c0_g2_i1.p1  ORF type:complete len:268 (+),score=25.40 TRINITY_DN4168_c0_g2_i1:34-837(+)
MRGDGSLVLGYGATQRRTDTHHGARASTPSGSHRKAIVLASMYKRIPNAFLERAEGKKPASCAVQKIPWREDGKHTWETVGRGKGDAKFAIWERQPLRKGCSLDDALFQVESMNLAEGRILKYQVSFEDGSRMRFERTNINDPGSLVCKEFYSAVGRVGADRPVKPMKFLVNSQGHLLRRRAPHPGANSLTSRIDRTAESGSSNFCFTPVGFIRHQVRQNINRPGVRPGLRESSSQATQFRPRMGNRASFSPETMSNQFFTPTPKAP